MLKSELIERLIATNPELKPEEIAESVNVLLETMSDSLSEGMRIEIRDFGSWFVLYRPERNAHNPRTGKKVIASAKYTPRFKPGKELRERVNASSHLPIKDADDESDE